eukprot:SM000012S25327  [mRNA]  locus=s12:304110:313728:- [translate_table: standard]
MAKTRRKKKRTHSSAAPAGAPGRERPPQSFVFSRGARLGASLRQLERDLRRLMLPNTALRLRVRPPPLPACAGGRPERSWAARRARAPAERAPWDALSPQWAQALAFGLKDFVHVSGPLGVTHFVILSVTQEAPYLRVARTPRGPTLTFKVLRYSLAADIASSQARPRAPPAIFKNPPLVVMHGFGSGKEHLKLVTVMFQNMFPAINVQKVKLAACQRVLLLSYNAESRTVEFRHYSISAQPVGVSKPVRKLVQSRALPDLGMLTDVGDFFARSGYGSESEAEDEAAKVKLSQNFGRSNRACSQSAVKLHEVGPRITLQLLKVEEGLCNGAVMFHEFVQKTEEEKAILKSKIEARDALKKQRKAEQDANVLRKRKAPAHIHDDGELEDLTAEETETGGQAGEADDDIDWYRREVGEEPDEAFVNAVPRHMGRGGASKRGGFGRLSPRPSRPAYNAGVPKFQPRVRAPTHNCESQEQARQSAQQHLQVRRPRGQATAGSAPGGPPEDEGHAVEPAAATVHDDLYSLLAGYDLRGVPGLDPLEVLRSYDPEAEKKAQRREMERLKQEAIAQTRVRKVDDLGRAYATGKRKASIARVWVKEGQGVITVNGRGYDLYFPDLSLRAEMLKPFLETRTVGAFDVRSTVQGGGTSGQAGALRHGISKALQLFDPQLRPALKAAGLLTRDARVVERKKPGRHKARKSFQWVKR